MKYTNRPPHIFQDESIYFLTARTLNGNKYFDSDQKKEMILSVLKSALSEFDFGIFAWVILDNHYHLQVKVNRGIRLSDFVKKINGVSARNLNLLTNQTGRKVWWNYWDKCLATEKDFWVHFNYIHNNPIKHGYLSNLEQLAAYRFSSFSYYLKNKGKEWIDSIFTEYSIIDFTLKDD
ncbi:MAG: transposase [Candidatus Buchananbacteria bacterium]|nr:transposase [Candidatus Buchananbacteria bacterium]